MYDISVVIPAYNAEKYIGTCLDSVFKQKTRLSFEVICVDNASNDSTPVILRNYQDYKNFRIVRKEVNVNCYGARQAGLDVVDSKYLLYLDSDDYLDEDALSTLERELSKYKDLDAVIFQYREFYSETGETMRICSHFERIDEVITGEKAFLENDIPSMPWNRLLKVDTLKKNHIDYAKGMPDDVDFDFRHYPILKRVVLINKVLIHYRCIPTSTSRGIQAFVPYIEGFAEMIPRHLLLSKKYGSSRYWNKTFFRDFFDVYMYAAKYILYKRKDNWLTKNLKVINDSYGCILKRKCEKDKYYLKLKWAYSFRKLILSFIVTLLKLKKIKK